MNKTKERDVMMIAVKGKNLIDGTGATPVPDAVVLVEDDRIKAVGSANQIEIPADVETIDVGEATILPLSLIHI